MDLSWATSRAEDFRRHLLDLEGQSYEGTTDRGDRERVFETAVGLMSPIVHDVLATFDRVMLGGTGSIEDGGLIRATDGSVEREWSLSWPGQANAERRVGDPGPVGPITIRAFFPPGWTHGHLGGSVVAAWPLQIVTPDDAARQAGIIWAIAEAEFHQRIYETVRPWERVPEPIGVGAP